ncbi:chemotaxis protein CheD [Magnetococcales bacterium HHB-1]
MIILNETHDRIPQIYLDPAELSFCTEPTILRTILGSCVSIVLYAPRKRFGALCHSVLPSIPHRIKKKPALTKDSAARYVDSSIASMIHSFKKHGVSPDELIVKLFGGSDMFEVLPNGGNSVGQKNIAAAYKVLKKFSLEPRACDVGGVRGRKIIFETHTGTVYVQKLQKSQPITLPKRRSQRRDTFFSFKKAS